ncbi:hypothetical protein [Pontibacter flavimaris]|uniref:Uncharacterized protein n=1 Tax=Pontibacter flavimaris TaxID=1797110 RepID=A0A1Q5PEN7_9BACT|nr:hypothetical protein [Pontibacter flavimaris]OKL40677.1 hypothetical protein A3841_12520 [Pontibacter flavimaris]
MKHLLKYPLMWVMLLWAITLPGHEQAVYRLISKGAISELGYCLLQRPGEQRDTALGQEAVQVLPYAKMASPTVLPRQQATRCFPQLYTLARPADRPLPENQQHSSGAGLLAKILPATILPNAP